MKSFTLIIVLYLFVTFKGEAMAATVDISMCEQNWEQLTKEYGIYNYATLLGEWKKRESLCGGTGLYEYRLASLYERLGDLENAISILSEVKTFRGKYSKFIRLSLAYYEFSQLFQKKNAKPEDFSSVETSYAELIRDFPDWYVPEEQLAYVQVSIGKYDESEKHAKAALKLNSKSVSAMRTLVIVHTFRGEYEKTIPFTITAIEIDETLLGETEFMYAAAWSNISLGRTDDAETLLEMLLERNPAVKNEVMFNKAVAYLRQEQKKKKK